MSCVSPYLVKLSTTELKSLGFQVKELGLRQKLAQGVPDDASVVYVLGPVSPFLQAEVDALRSYLESGGSLFIGLEPRLSRPDLPPPPTDPLEDMIEDVLGVRMADGIVADEVNHVKQFVYADYSLDSLRQRGVSPVLSEW